MWIAIFSCGLIHTHAPTLLSMPSSVSEFPVGCNVLRHNIYMSNVSNSNFDSTQEYLRSLVASEIDVEQLQSFMDYAQAVIDSQIKALRVVLNQMTEPYNRLECLAALNVLYVVRSNFDVAKLVKESSELKDGKKLNVLR